MTSTNQPTPSIIPAFEPATATKLYYAGQHAELSDYFLGFLEKCAGQSWLGFAPEDQRRLAAFLKTFLYLFTQENYLLSDVHGERFVRLNPLISNLLAMSPFKTTDPWLQVLRMQQANFIKILTLLNPRCETQFDIDQLFQARPDFATLWYIKYYDFFYGGTPSKLILENGTRHVEAAPKQLRYVGPAMSNFYFFPTYFAAEKEAGIKRVYHELVKPIMNQAKVNNRPNKRSIAIVSGRWNRTSAVYRSLAPFVEALRGDYDLTLVCLGTNDKTKPILNREWFKDVRYVYFNGNQLDVTEVLENDFALAYFMDVGMQNEDRHLCDLRIAPIQIMSYGHPVSTHGSEIDYFLGGQDSEYLPDILTNNSERLVAIPGIGSIPVFPDSPRVLGRAPGPNDPIIINCPWYAHKVSYPHLLTLRRIVEQSTKPIRFRIFVGPALGINNQYLSFRQEVVQAIGSDNVDVILERPYHEYQLLMDEGAFAIDSYPFGGFNTIIDSLWIGKPVVALQGKRSFARFATAVLRKIGLGELAATTDDEFVAITLKLIHDNDYRVRVTNQVLDTDLDAKLCEPYECQGFKRVVGYLLENHDRLKEEGSREPLRVD